MDWSNVRSSVSVSTWHGLVESSDTTAELPKNVVEPGNLTQIWLTKQGVPGKVIEFTQGVSHQQYGPRLRLMLLRRILWLQSLD